MIDKQKAIIAAAIIAGWGIQYWESNRIIRDNKRLRKENELLKEKTNKALYVSMYLANILDANGIELSKFDLTVLDDPPCLFNDEAPTLFQEMIEKGEYFIKFPKEN